MNYRKIFEPIKIGSMTLKNRIVMGPMGTSLANIDNSLSDRQLAYYKRRAQGGVSMIILEHAYPQIAGCKSKKSLGIWDHNLLPKWKNFIEELHEYGCKTSIEIGHLGRCTDFSRLLGETALAPSPIRCRMLKEPVRAASDSDIKKYQQDYLNSVRIAKEAGFDSIQLHFTNGYFLAEWISGRTNRRTDIYGGNFENRLRMALELIALVRAEVGRDYPLIARLASREEACGRGIEETRMIARAFEEAGIDALDINSGSPEEYDWEFPSYYKQQGFLLEDAEKIKRSVKIPVMSGGRIVEPRMAEQALLEGRIDMVEINRGLVADPDWLLKVSNGKIDEIHRCIGCTRCIHEKEKEGIICSVNPFVGREKEWLVQRAREKKNVLVIGGGPAGLQAAVIASKRGHKVTLMEKNKYLGGMLSVAAMAPPKWEIVNIVTALAAEANEIGVEIRTNCEATAETVSENKYDTVIVACGSKPIMFSLDGSEIIPCSTAVQVLAGDFWPGNNVLIIGGGMIGCECAEYLSVYDKKITIIEMLDGVAKDMSPNLRDLLLKKLKGAFVDIKCNSKVKGITDKGVVYEEDGEEKLLSGVDSIVFAVGLKPEETLKNSLKKRNISFIDIGDCNKVSRLQEALVSAVKATINL